VPSDKILDMITHAISLKKLRSAALENGMVPLYKDGLQKVAAGITTIDEILRVVTIDEEAV
jgi:general secretion pathway protein E